MGIEILVPISLFIVGALLALGLSGMAISVAEEANKKK